MIALFSFINFLKLDKKPQEQKKFKEYHQKKVENQIIELDENENFYKQKSEIVISYENGKEIKEEVIEEQIPLSKNTAKKQIAKQRIN